MGQRANVLVIEDGQRTLFYDHWAASRLDRELFWGPDESLRFARQRDPVAEDGGWLDEIWCEGAAIVDCDRRVLLFFGGEDVAHDVRLRVVHLDLLRRQWPGWEVRWAREGLMSIADELGAPRETFASGRDFEPCAFLVFEEPASNDVLLTETLADGRLWLGRIAGIDEGLLHGPRALESFPAGAPRLEWTGAFPVGGLHVDRARRELTTWWAAPRGRLARVDETWAGWTVRWLFDDFKAHLRLLGDALALPPFDVLATQRRILDNIEETLVDAPPRNPVRELDEILEPDAQISPWTDHSRGSERSAGKRARLVRLRRELRL